MAKVEGVNEVLKVLNDAGKRADEVSVIVGYTQAYAIYVHENLEAKHPVGQAKYLEEPARVHAAEIGRIVREAFAKGASLAHALLLGGLRIQRESQLLVPVDTGALKGSAFTMKE